MDANESVEKTTELIIYETNEPTTKIGYLVIVANTIFRHGTHKIVICL